MRKYCLVWLVCAMAFVSGCNSADEAVPDIDYINETLEIERFEHDLARYSAEREGAELLREAYPVFFDSIWMQIMLPGRPVPGADSALVAAFAQPTPLHRLLDSVLLAYPRSPTPAAWERELETAFRYARHYFPDAPIPRVITYLSELSLGALTYGEDLVGIGLDFFMGSNFTGYSTDIFPVYIKRSMTPVHIAPDAVEVWLQARTGAVTSDRFLDKMIHYGKLNYMKERLLPHLPDTAVLGYSAEQLAWLQDNEAAIWAFYLEEELLYETNRNRIAKHIGPSPNAPGMPPEAPGANARWMGMRIVEQYMRRHPQTSLPQLIELSDAQLLLNESRYKPPRG